MSSSNPKAKFVSKGQLVDTVPVSVRLSRFINQTVLLVSLYLWTLFSLNAKNALTTFSSPSATSSSTSTRKPDQKPRIGRVNNSNN